MDRPVWFYQTRIAGIPAHWTPCTWQGWLVTAIYTLVLLGMIFHDGPAAGKGHDVVSIILLTAAMVAVAALTGKDAPAK